MLKHTRVTGIMDVGRLAEAVSMPGIDPRTWVSFAVVTAIGSDAEGFFADVTMVPGMVDIPCRIALPYAGPGFGTNNPLALNDEVVVVIPDGSPAHGGVVVARLWSASDAPPQDALDNPDDSVTVMKPGQNFRLGVSGGGKAFLGQTTATDAAVRGTTYRQAEDVLFSALNTFMGAVETFNAALVIYMNGIKSIADPTNAFTSTMVTAVGALTTAAGVLATAVSTFQAADPTYLSNSVAVGQ